VVEQKLLLKPLQLKEGLRQLQLKEGLRQLQLKEEPKLVGVENLSFKI
jgi:hypothetical protein